MSDHAPVIRMGRYLLVRLQGDLDDRAVESIEHDVTHEVARTGACGVMLDVSGLEVVDSFVARVLARLVAMIGLLGAEGTIVGIQPAVAITLLELGIGMQHLRTALNAADGMALLNQIRE
jgi:rsbT antagonist protein RsbS